MNNKYVPISDEDMKRLNELMRLYPDEIPETEEEWKSYKAIDDEHHKIIEKYNEINKNYYTEVKTIYEQNQQKCKECKNSIGKSCKPYEEDENEVLKPSYNYQCTKGFEIRNTGYCKGYQNK